MYSADGEKTDDKDLIEVVKQMYFNLNDSSTKCQLLSLVVNKYTKAELMSCFEGVTKHQIDTARKHAFVHGPGSSLPSGKSTYHRERISEEKLHHAIDFFSNPSFNQISSYSTKQMKLDTGETLHIPEIVRTVIHANLIKMYKIYCKENNFISLSDATLFQILKTCSASQRKCLKGLDNVAVDGAAAYDILLSITKKLDQPENWKQVIQKKITASNLYMKTEFKVHIQKESECAFHCHTFALSDPKSADFKEVCPHEHTKRCENCELVQNIASEIEKAILTSALEDQDKDSLLQELQISVQQINDWRSHIVRTINQDNARHAIIGSLKINQVLIVMDWAMKYLPFKFREKITDWFGQKGVHLHISVCIFRGHDGELMHKTFTHILDHVKQDFFAVLSLLEHTLQSIKKLLPAIDEAFIRSDNAGCYHCGHLWLSIPRLSDRTGVHVRRYDFSEAQSGKSYCDAKIAHMRGKMRTYAAEGNDVTTAEKMKIAIDKGSGVKGVYSAVVEVDTTNQVLNSHSWKGINAINNLEFLDDGAVRVWKAFEIGSGQLLTKTQVEKLYKEDQPATNLNVLVDFCDNHTSGIIHFKTNEKNNDIEVESNDAVLPLNEFEKNEEFIPDLSDGNVFCCTEYGCTKKYCSFEKLQDHLLSGKHKMRKECESTGDRVKRLWKEKTESIAGNARIDLTEDLEDSASVCLEMGWALKKDKRYVRFSQNVKLYLNDVFLQGEVTGHKANPATTAVEMRNVMEDGKKKFSPCEWLQPSQVSSYFSRLALNHRTGRSKKPAFVEKLRKMKMTYIMNVMKWKPS